MRTIGRAPDGLTDMPKLKVAFRNFVKAPKTICYAELELQTMPRPLPSTSLPFLYWHTAVLRASTSSAGLSVFRNANSPTYRVYVIWQDYKHNRLLLPYTGLIGPSVGGNWVFFFYHEFEFVRNICMILQVWNKTHFFCVLNNQKNITFATHNLRLSPSSLYREYKLTLCEECLNRRFCISFSEVNAVHLTTPHSLLFLFLFPPFTSVLCICLSFTYLPFPFVLSSSLLF